LRPKQVARALLDAPHNATVGIVFLDSTGGAERHERPSGRQSLDAPADLTDHARHRRVGACHDAKYTYWMIGPSQADPDIKTAIGLPNHPSYPSNHACLSGTAAVVLANEFPAERAQLERQADDATVSRYSAGLHYRFDGDSGRYSQRVSRFPLVSGIGI